MKRTLACTLLLLTLSTCTNRNSNRTQYYFVPLEIKLKECPPEILGTLASQIGGMFRYVEGLKGTQIINKKGVSTVYLKFDVWETAQDEAFFRVGDYLRLNRTDFSRQLGRLPTVKPLIEQNVELLRFTVHSDLKGAEAYQAMLAAYDDILMLPNVYWANAPDQPEHILAITARAGNLSGNNIAQNNFENGISSLIKSFNRYSSIEKPYAEHFKQLDFTNSLYQNFMFSELASVKEQYLHIDGEYTFEIAAEPGYEEELEASLKQLAAENPAFTNQIELKWFNPLCQNTSDGLHLLVYGKDIESLAMDADKLVTALESEAEEAEVHCTAGYHTQKLLRLKASKLEKSRATSYDVYRTYTNVMNGKQVGNFKDGDDNIGVYIYYVEQPDAARALSERSFLYLSNNGYSTTVRLQDYLEYAEGRYYDTHYINRKPVLALEINTDSEHRVQFIQKLQNLKTSGILSPETSLEPIVE